jgi:hypothetical protein
MQAHGPSDHAFCERLHARLEAMSSSQSSLLRQSQQAVHRGVSSWRPARTHARAKNFHSAHDHDHALRYHDSASAVRSPRRAWDERGAERLYEVYREPAHEGQFRREPTEAQSSPRPGRFGAADEIPIRTRPTSIFPAFVSRSHGSDDCLLDVHLSFSDDDQ